MASGTLFSTHVIVHVAAHSSLSVHCNSLDADLKALLTRGDMRRSGSDIIAAAAPWCHDDAEALQLLKDLNDAAALV